MSNPFSQKLSQVLRRIDRPGSFCVSDSIPAVLLGLEVTGLGPIGLPLAAKQAQELKKLCQAAPYGKGEETIVDTSVRRVWQMKPDRFTLTNPDWQQFLQQMVRTVQEGLGLEEQQLESHLHDLLLYEPGSFFLPHRDGEKLARMVATLVIVLPSSFEGGELVVRHEGQELTIDFTGSDKNLFRIHWAAFYADCEHEVRPLRGGYRLCLVYNLTLKKGKKAISAPRSLAFIEPISQILRDWATEGGPRKLAVTLEHEYTQDGLAWEALKGADRVKARVLAEAAHQAGCRAYLGLLTFHEAGSAEGDDSYYYDRHRRWHDDEDAASGEYEMGEVYETSLTADHWSNQQGKRMPFGEIVVEEEELIEPESLKAVDPEEQFEGYTGNAGMTLDRWYRHGAIFLWPNKRHFEVLCGAGSRSAIESLKLQVEQWQKSSKKNASALRAECIEFASAIIATWRENPFGRYYGEPNETCPFVPLLEVLDDPALIKAHLAEVMIKDVSVDPGEALVRFCQKHGWKTFDREFKAIFQTTTTQTIARNVRLLEQLCLANPREKEEWIELCASLAQAVVQALIEIDQPKDPIDYRAREIDRVKVLVSLARSLLATEQFELLSRVVSHTLVQPAKYPLIQVHVAALTALEPWVKKHVRKRCPPLGEWIAECRGQLESRTAQVPEAPADFRRAGTSTCKCADCAELRHFLEDPKEEVHRFRVVEGRRKHLQHRIAQDNCDVDCTTERRGSPHTLVCTKNTASYHAGLKTYHHDLEHRATLRSIQANLPK